jgi:hypothetical protein
MAKVCGVCGRSGILIKGYQCALCDKWICDSHRDMPCATVGVNVTVYNHIMANAPSAVQKQNLTLRTNCCQVFTPLNMCPSCFGWMDHWSKDLHGVLLKQEKEHNHKIHLEKAKNLELSGRYEDAALEYEHLEMWEDAGRARRAGSTHTVKNVTVNLNELLSDIKRGGLALNYKCHVCGAAITIGAGGFDIPKVCPYCASAVNAEVMTDLLKSALR